MPRGAKPGERRGGRAVGTKNRATIEKERIAAEIAERTMMDARTQGKKLAKEVLEDFMTMFASMAAVYQPMAPGQRNTDPKRDPNPDLFEKYAKLTIECATKLAPYQSPRFQAVAITAPPPSSNEERRRFTLSIFEGAPPPQMIEQKR